MRTNCPICNKNHKTFPDKCVKISDVSKNEELKNKMKKYLEQFQPLLELIK